ncbi:hypothetical protein OIU84_012381 [Salix udensis]|uniref:Uncharacterized protein n=1 Tax=Salix udensis TaxID=889485 RepID=A0AAD6JFK7_9ROSI|nr:hypothetical protein OIU84_012381 [Salix udensis]
MFLMQRIQYAKTKSDIVAKADGTFVPREKRRRHEEKGKKKKDQHDANQVGVGLTPAYGGTYGDNTSSFSNTLSWWCEIYGP